MSVRVIEQRPNGIDFIEITSDELKVVTCNLGCHLISIFAKDRNGIADDVLLGYKDIEDCHKDGSYMGAIIGRVGNRIAKGRFTLNGKEYQLAINNGPNHLHGGMVGFDRKIFHYELLRDGVRFHYLSPDGEEGYPGNFDLTVTYRVIGNEVSLTYKAKCDEDTLANITNHAYFNLSGGKDTIHDHVLRLASDKVGIIDEDILAVGGCFDVEGTPFDFRQGKTIGQDIDADDEQLHFAKGYDHSFLFSDNYEQAELYDPKSGRGMKLSTSMPAVQVYTSNFLAGGIDGKQGVPYENRMGVCLETQYMPNSINYEEDPKMLLRKGQTFRAMTVLQFYAK